MMVRQCRRCSFGLRQKRAAGGAERLRYARYTFCITSFAIRSNEGFHMNGTILITGGAGFIGSHLARELVDAGYRVRALDNLAPQVHGAEPSRPKYLHPSVELIVGDV